MRTVKNMFRNLPRTEEARLLISRAIRNGILSSRTTRGSRAIYQIIEGGCYRGCVVLLGKGKESWVGLGRLG